MSKLSCNDELHLKCGRSCGEEPTSLMTRLAIIEGSILEQIEKNVYVTVHQLMEELEWGPCAIAMSVGSLVRQGILRSFENKQEVYLEINKLADP